MQICEHFLSVLASGGIKSPIVIDSGLWQSQKTGKVDIRSPYQKLPAIGREVASGRFASCFTYPSWVRCCRYWEAKSEMSVDPETP